MMKESATRRLEAGDRHSALEPAFRALFRLMEPEFVAGRRKGDRNGRCGEKSGF
jgi:hypothetical protein